MTSVPVFLAAAVVAGTAMTAGFAQSDAGVLTCAIDVREAPGGVRLSGKAVAKSDLAGSYTFSVTKQDDGGTSEISQGGDFRVSAGRPGVLNEVALSISRSGSYRAELSLTWPGGTRSCEKRYPPAG